jgi:hypothetical protein
MEGQGGPPTKWAGVRAPAIKDKDDGTWKKGQPIALFNGKDLTNADEADPGPCIVQGDHSYVEIKSFVVTPLIH